MSLSPDIPGLSAAGLAAKRSSRKSHRKSRNGCDDCKRRRIKCDEQKPACTNCIKHSSRCSFSQYVLPKPDVKLPLAKVPQNSASSPQTKSPLPPGPMRTASNVGNLQLDLTLPAIVPARPNNSNPALGIQDLELLHNYDTSTSYTLATIPALQTFLRLDVPRIAFSHPFLLHGILGVSALHLAHFKKTFLTQYSNEAQNHYRTGLNIATSLLSLSKHTSSALYLFALLTITFTLGSGPKVGNFLLFGDRCYADEQVIFRAVRNLLELHPEILERSDLSPIFAVSIRQMLQPAPNNQHLDRLRHSIIQSSSKSVGDHVYLTALELLGRSFPSTEISSSRASQTSPQTVFAWLLRLSDEFLSCLKKRDPIALVIFAHFCVLLNDLGSLWFMKGWVEHLLSEIHRSLGEDHRIWITWPMQEIGWIPGS